MSIPNWIHEAIFYQIFPDRFFDGEADNNPPNVQPWGSPPTSWGFQGGDLAGIIQKFDYLLDLGVNAIYLNPIFQATSNHRYNTSDYYKIDPKLGTMEDFHSLIEIAHRNHMHIILDGVFNHCGRGFFAFNDVMENQEYSAYRQWYYIKHFPINAYSWGESSDYLGWWGMKSLPKFNTGAPMVRNYLLGVARYWLEQGADGWRLDVPNEINDDSFWAEFRQVVKTANPEAYLVGEIWSEDKRWVGEGHFDGLMNYPVMEAITGLLGSQTLDVSQFAEKVEGLLAYYPGENLEAMYTLLGSHDTARILTKLGKDVKKARLAYLFQFAYPGIPAIYYGDEVGLTGGKDPGCRGAFPWDESEWNVELRSFIKTLIRLRKEHPALQRGTYVRAAKQSNPAYYAFMRKVDDDQVMVILNPSSSEQHITLDLADTGWSDRGSLNDLVLPERKYPVSDHKLEISLPGYEGVWIG
ncbi:MAG: glycoside hydrolase family 13 protein [Acidobacteriaceae bacterium]